MSLPTQEPIPRVRSQDNMHLWAKELYDFLSKNLPVFQLLTGSLTLVNGANNNILPADSMLSYIGGPTAGFNITGIGGGSGGRVLVIYNTTVQVMTIRDQNAGSTANNRIITMTGADLVATIALLVYSDRDNRWLVLAAR